MGVKHVQDLSNHIDSLQRVLSLRRAVKTVPVKPSKQIRGRRVLPAKEDGAASVRGQTDADVAEAVWRSVRQDSIEGRHPDAPVVPLEGALKAPFQMGDV